VVTLSHVIPTSQCPHLNDLIIYIRMFWTHVINSLTIITNSGHTFNLVRQGKTNKTDQKIIGKWIQLCTWKCHPATIFQKIVGHIETELRYYEWSPQKARTNDHIIVKPHNLGVLSIISRVFFARGTSPGQKWRRTLLGREISCTQWKGPSMHSSCLAFFSF
jgi:hypothetical protein